MAVIGEPSPLEQAASAYALHLRLKEAVKRASVDWLELRHLWSIYYALYDRTASAFPIAEVVIIIDVFGRGSVTVRLTKSILSSKLTGETFFRLFKYGTPQEELDRIIQEAINWARNKRREILSVGEWLSKIKVKQFLTRDEDYENVKKAMESIAEVLEHEGNELTIVAAALRRSVADEIEFYAYGLSRVNAALEMMYQKCDELRIWVD